MSVCIQAAKKSSRRKELVITGVLGMRQISEIAKNLLNDKSCDNCQHMIIDRGTKMCVLNHTHVVTIDAALAHRVPRDNTCANWTKRWGIGWHTDHET